MVFMVCVKADSLSLGTECFQVYQLHDWIDGTVDEVLLIGADIHVGDCPRDILGMNALFELPLVRVLSVVEHYVRLR